MRHFVIGVFCITLGYMIGLNLPSSRTAGSQRVGLNIDGVDIRFAGQVEMLEPEQHDTHAVWRFKTPNRRIEITSFENKP